MSLKPRFIRQNPTTCIHLSTDYTKQQQKQQPTLTRCILPNVHGTRDSAIMSPSQLSLYDLPTLSFWQRVVTLSSDIAAIAPINMECIDRRSYYYWCLIRTRCLPVILPVSDCMVLNWKVIELLLMLYGRPNNPGLWGSLKSGMSRIDRELTTWAHFTVCGVNSCHRPSVIWWFYLPKASPRNPSEASSDRSA